MGVITISDISDSSCDESFTKSVDAELAPSEKELLRIEEEVDISNYI